MFFAGLITGIVTGIVITVIGFIVFVYVSACMHYNETHGIIQ